MNQEGNKQEQIVKTLEKDLDHLLSKAQAQIENVNREIKKLYNLHLLTKAEKLVDNALLEIKQINHEILPKTTIDLGLVSIISELASRFRRKTKLNFELHMPNEEPELKDMQLVNIYRIILEIVNNVIHHAQASTIYIKVEHTNSQLYMFIEDDGKGFNVTKKELNGRPGIERIRARVRYLNGSVELISLPGHGTNYNIQLPIFIH